MDERIKTRKVYDKNAALLKKKYETHPPRIEAINLAFSSCKKKNPNVLEIGCAYGRDAKEILKKTKNYIGIDYSKSMIRLARKNIPKTKFIVADALIYKFPKNQEIIFSFASLLHSDKKKLEIILDKINASLNKDGVFYLSLKYGKYKKRIIKEIYGERVFYDYTPTIIKKISKHKFDVIYEKIHELQGQKWLELILQKID